MYQGDRVTLMGLGWGEWVCGDSGCKGKIWQAERVAIFGQTEIGLWVTVLEKRRSGY
jgi:hypothetical protein